MTNNNDTFWLIKFCWRLDFINLLWPCDAIWHHRTCSGFVQAMACCLTAPSHYLNQGWFTFKCVLWHSPESTFKRSVHELKVWHVFRDNTFKIIITSPRGISQRSLMSMKCNTEGVSSIQWVNIGCPGVKSVQQINWCVLRMSGIWLRLYLNIIEK